MSAATKDAPTKVKVLTQRVMGGDDMLERFMGELTEYQFLAAKVSVAPWGYVVIYPEAK